MRVRNASSNCPLPLCADLAQIEERKKRGDKVISFAIGDPDIPTPDHIIERLCREARVPANPATRRPTAWKRCGRRWGVVREAVRCHAGPRQGGPASDRVQGSVGTSPSASSTRAMWP